MTEWFGKGCKYLCAQWEENEITGGPNYKESEPILVFCTHIENNNEYEGNCNLELCPKIKDKKNMIINLKKIGQYFTLKNLWHKTFNDFSQEEIEGLCDVVLSESNMSGKIISQCHACGSISFWRVKGEKSKWICKECHPPATDMDKEFLHIEINDKDW